MSTGARQRGMSLIEILVTIAIIGMLMAYAAPAATTWIQNTQVRNAAESIFNGVQAARIEALKRNQTVSFSLTDPNSTAWQICLYDPIANTCLTTPGAIIQEKPASEGGANARAGADTVASSPATALPPGTNLPSSVTFDPLGRLATTAPTNMRRIDVRNPQMDAGDERRLVVLVGVGGQVRMCDPKLVLSANPMGCQ